MPASITLYLVKQGEDVLDQILKTAEYFRSFRDAPWYKYYRELDERFPESKFILTLRKDAETYANSAYRFNLSRGKKPLNKVEYVKYVDKKVSIYNEYNNTVLEYFKGREQDLLIVCWENCGDQS